MWKIVAYVGYSNVSIMIHWLNFIGALIFLVLCGILIFQNLIWEEEDYSLKKNVINGKLPLLIQIRAIFAEFTQYHRNKKLKFLLSLNV